MESQPSDSTESEEPPLDEDPPSFSSPPSPDVSSPPPPSPSTNDPDPPENVAPPPPKSPETSPPPPISSQTSPSPPSTNIPKQSPPTPSQPPPENLPPSPPSETPPQSNETSPPSPSGTPLVTEGAPAHRGSNNVSGISESNGGGIGTIGVVAIGLLLLGVIGLAVWWFGRRKKKPNGDVGPELPTILGFSSYSESASLKKRSTPAYDSKELVYESASETPRMGNSKNVYSYKELARATNKFSVSNLLGEGGFGSVFKGLLPDGREVAVKQLRDGGGQGEREFRAEVETISRIHHRHLVSLVGYCISNEKRLLVYDYVPNNTLYFHLHGHGETVLDWPMRIKIATGAARGIAYLHEDCHPRIVHRDIKSSNILLDNHFEAQVSDFGLARLFSDANTHVTTRVMGTFGYMAPEYASSGKLTEKSDVFSFGVVLLELITGRKPVDTSQPMGEASLVEWARPLLTYALEKENFENLIDPRLQKNYVDSEMFRMIEAASASVRYSALKRPKMSQILRAFDDMLLADLTNGFGVGESEIGNSARQSAEIRLFQRMAFGSQDYTTDFFTQGEMKTEEN